MVARYTARLLLGMVFAMILLGGIVHGTGSSLACPDWPLCYGEAMPAMEGGILFEHSHRLLGAAIGLAMIVLSAGLFVEERGRSGGSLWYGAAAVSVMAQLAVFGVAVSTASPGSLWLESLLVAAFLVALAQLQRRGMTLTVLGLVGLELVVIQGLLGGLTVVMRLPPLVSTIHLTIAMTLLAGLCYLAFRLRPGVDPGEPIGTRRLLAVAIAALFGQIVLGAFMRHTGSTLACGAEILTCQGAAWGGGGAAHTALAHRWFAFAVAVLLIVSTLPLLRAAKATGRKAVRVFAIATHALVLLQIVLGFAALLYYVPVSLATLHQGIAALLLVNSVALFLAAGPWGARSRSRLESTPERMGGLEGLLSASR